LGKEYKMQYLEPQACRIGRFSHGSFGAFSEDKNELEKMSGKIGKRFKQKKELSEWHRRPIRFTDVPDFGSKVENLSGFV